MPGTTVTPTLARPAAGFFGKLPSRGDFIGRHLPKSFVGPWDSWLQTAVAHSRDQLGENWQEYYCTSPVWRFALGPGLCGPAAYAGIMMPSMDRVGRYYPLAIAAALAPGWPLFTLPASGEAWFRQAERLALAALERDELDLDQFSQQVAALGAPLADDLPATTTGPASGDDAWYCPLPQALESTGVSPFLASDLLRRGFPCTACGGPTVPTGSPAACWSVRTCRQPMVLRRCWPETGNNGAGMRKHPPASPTVRASHPPPKRNNHEPETRF
ncbi:MAG: type VI secretion system-associated protein TagF [Candidatus Competibacteraceae bacterium]